MAYNKKNWQDNVSDVTAAELNRMEQGIYDNSLVVDAVTNTINPTDTETYKTAELTEGQITDVIGVSDIVIKGDTEQDGTPTPSAPVDVNVVSGSNVININNKNLFDSSIIIKQTKNGITANFENGEIVVSGTATASISLAWTYKLKNSLLGKTLTLSYIGSFSNINNVGFKKDGTNKVVLNSSVKNSSFEVTQALIDDINQFSIFCLQGSSINARIKIQLEESSTATTYEPHQGKELPLDLPVENLFDVKKITENTAITDSGQTATSSVSNLSNYIKVKNSTSYTLTYEYSTLLNQSQRNVCFYNDRKEFIESIRYTPTNKTNTISTPINGTYLRFSYDKNCTDIKLQETNSQTDPIELCKIGDYQDYFYKSGSKWYLHKEINKKVLNGSENWQLANSGTSNYYYYYNLGHTTIQSSSIASTHYPYAFISNSNTEQGILVLADGNIRIRYGTEDTVANFKTWLANNNVSVYYPLATATDTEITDTNLISQLEAIYNAPLYEETNITQENNDLPMILDITACKDNINGIKAFIRK